MKINNFLLYLFTILLVQACSTQKLPMPSPLDQTATVQMDIDELNLFKLDIVIADSNGDRAKEWEKFRFKFETVGAGKDKKLLITLEDIDDNNQTTRSPPHIFDPEMSKTKIDVLSSAIIQLKHIYIPKNDPNKTSHELTLTIIKTIPGRNIFMYRIRHDPNVQSEHCHTEQCATIFTHTSTSGGGRGSSR